MIDIYPGSVAVAFAGQSLQLLPRRAIWWPVRETLLVADVHIGKGAAFRSAGVPVPAGSSVKDLARLGELLDMTGAKRLVILGDFLHARTGRQPEVLDAVRKWREAHRRTSILLVRGNHDRGAGRVPLDWNIEEVDDPHVEDGVRFAHVPCENQSLPSFCGHVHPVFALRDYDRTSVRAPCFVIDQKSVMLPAFGTFTGGEAVGAAPGRRIYIVTEKRVVAVS